MKIIFALSFALYLGFLNSSCQNKGKIEILPIRILDYDTITNLGEKIFRIKSNHYLVRHYYDTPETDSIIEAFVAAKKDSLFDPESHSFSMIFYKESSETNLENINRMKWRVIDRYSQDHDQIFDFELKNDGYVKQKIKNGEIVNDSSKAKIEIQLIEE